LDDDVLYSLVDLNTYLNSIPSFSLGDSFAVVDGTTPALPGMSFSTTPFASIPGPGSPARRIPAPA